MKELFIDKNFHAKSYAMINKANEIIDEYQAQGFTLTLRQLYYQFVSRDILPNKQRSYDNLGSLISQARLAGLIDWTAIEDRTRFLRGHTKFASPIDSMQKALKRYRISMWDNQDVRIEVWIEKDALIGVIERICSKWDIDFFACRGYVSQSELYDAGKRIQYYRSHFDKETIVLHLGDHDPSGCDMTRDNEDRLSMFASEQVDVRRLALNMPQIIEYNPPPNPAKLTDTRAQEYIRRHGNSSWELDALEPKLIASLIENEVKSIYDETLWEERESVLAEHKRVYTKAVDYARKQFDKHK